MLDALRNTADELRPVQVAFMAVASYKKTLRQMLQETSQNGLLAGRDARLSLWATLGGVEHQHSIAATTRHRNPNGTGLVSAWRELNARVKAYQRDVASIEREIERQTLSPKRHTQPNSRQGSLFGRQ